MAFPSNGQILTPFSRKPAPLMRRTDMESGPPKQARIAQRRPVAHELRIQYSQSEFAAFESWVDSEGAAGLFAWQDPRDGLSKQALLRLGTYTAEMVSTGDGKTMDWVVTLTLETYE